MNENLIIEGNTIYRLDPACMREKALRYQNHSWPGYHNNNNGLHSENRRIPLKGRDLILFGLLAMGGRN